MNNKRPYIIKISNPSDSTYFVRHSNVTRTDTVLFFIIVTIDCSKNRVIDIYDDYADLSKCYWISGESTLTHIAHVRSFSTHRIHTNSESFQRSDTRNQWRHCGFAVSECAVFLREKSAVSM